LQLLPSKDQKLLYQLDFEDEQLLFAKVSVSGVTTVPTKEEAEVDIDVSFSCVCPVIDHAFCHNNIAN